MSQCPRYLVIKDNCSFYVSLQCHNYLPLMKEDWVKEFFYERILKYKDYFGIKIYGYRFMDIFADLIGRTDKKENLSKMISRVSQLLARKYNRKIGRCGAFFMGKFKVKNIQSDMHLLKAMAQVDSTYHKLAKDGYPFKFEWTSYYFYSEGAKDPLVDPAPQYLALGRSNSERQKGYRNLIDGLGDFKGDGDVFGKGYFIGDSDWVVENNRPIRLWYKSNRNRLINHIDRSNLLLQENIVEN